MTPPIRYVERKDYSGFGGGDLMLCDGNLVTPYRTIPILQYQTPTGEWVDVPVVRDDG